MQLRAPVKPGSTLLRVQGRTLSASNLDKVLYPAAGFRKRDVLRYYRDVAPALLPHLHARALTLKRYPNGVGEHFYEKNCPSHRPGWVPTSVVNGIRYCRAESVADLLWVANLASLELHPLLSLVDDPTRPTCVAFDLDPGAPAALRECAALALELREHLGELGLEAFPKASGSKGLQVYVPLNTPCTFEQTKAFSRAVAEHFERRTPDRVVSRMARRLRPGKVFIDWSQNDESKTTVSVYSLRATDEPRVSMPLTWAEVAGITRGRVPAMDPGAVLRRVEKHGDLFEPVLTLRQRLPRSGSGRRVA